MALRKKKHDSHFNRKRPIEHSGFYPYMARYLEAQQVLGCSKDTHRRRESALRRFIAWSDERSLEDPREITKPILECYQKHLYYYRKSNGDPLSAGSQNVILTPIKSFFKWLTQENYLLYNPASELKIPKKPKRLPRSILSIEEVKTLLDQPETDTVSGLRDRAILETLYATGIRRGELVNLDAHSLDSQRQTLFVKSGKNDKDRYLPIGSRALYWIERYRLTARPQLLCDLNEPTLFLTDYGAPLQR